LVAPIFGDAVVGPDLTLWMAQVEDRLAALETPQGPQLRFALASTALTAAMAVANPFAEVLLTDLKVPGCSDGVHWYRADTGALIV
jgi:hypothetical protein